MTTYKTIADLPAGTAGGTDDLEVSQSGTSRRVTLDQVGALLGGGPPSGAAGGALAGTYPNPTLVGGPLTNYLTTANAVTNYAPINAPIFTGDARAVTPTAGDNDTSIATTAFVTTAVATAGKLLQVVSTVTGATSTGTTVIPFDDTIPQITEGNEYMTLAITPTSAASRLVIDVTWNGAHSAITVSIIVALFQDAVANALAVSAAPFTTTGDNNQNVKFTHVIASGSTAARTFRVRAGGSTAGTTRFNGFTATRAFGGVYASSIVIQEVL